VVSWNCHPPFFLFLAWWPSWLEVGITGHIFGRGPSKDHSTKVWLQLAQWFLRRRFLCEFPIGRTLWEIPIKIFLSETICSIRTKFWWNSHWMVLFQKCVRRFGPSTKMACEFPIGSYVKLSTAVQPSWSEGGTIRCNFGKGLFYQSLVPIEQLVPDKKIFMWISHRFLC
jgi:hypothetical protein